VLQNTLVAKDLAQANRIAFGKRRWRVVTLDGKLIDTSGTMSGGGNRVAKGAMSSRFAADEVGPEVVARMEKERDDADAKLRTLFQERQEAEAELAALQKRLPETETEISKIEMDVQTAVKRVEEGKRRIKELRSVTFSPGRRYGKRPKPPLIDRRANPTQPTRRGSLSSTRRYRNLKRSTRRSMTRRRRSDPLSRRSRRRSSKLAASGFVLNRARSTISRR
jgi:TolA-binding protein